MRSVEVTGKTKDEAITAAMIQLGVPQDQVNIEVLSESKGLLGLFSKSVKIRATLKEEAVEEEVKASPAAVETKPEIKTEVKAEKKPEKKVEKKPEVKPEKKKETKPETVKETPAAPAEAADEPEETHTIEVEGLTVTGEKVVINDTIEQRLRKANAGKKPEERQRRDDRSRDGRSRGDNRGRRDDRADRYDRSDRAEKQPANAPKENEEVKEEAPAVRSFEPKVYPIPADADKVMEQVREFLTTLLKAMGIEATIETAFSEEGILDVNIVGEGMGLIIGKRGATLDSLQYLATLVVNKDREDHVRLKLDTEGYRARRQETLEKLAVNMAKKAKRTGHRVVLEPMNPYERRIIHSALQSDRGVETHSDGEEPYRKVIITPKRRH